MERFEDKTVVEYRAEPGSRVAIHYKIERGNYTEGEYRQEDMKDMYGGIYAKAFILFFGEQLQYYIMEERCRITRRRAVCWKIIIRRSISFPGRSG